MMVMALGDFKTDFFGVEVVIMVMILRNVKLIFGVEVVVTLSDVKLIFCSENGNAVVRYQTDFFW